MQLNENRSLYLQIGQMIEDSILRDIFMEEERVPSTNELARLYAINPATAAKGINLLVDEGILYKKRGIGMFVTKGAKKEIRGKRKNSFYKEFIVKLVNEAGNLGIGHDELLEMIQKAERLADK